MADITYNDILSESLDITQTPFTDDLENTVVQVTTIVDGIPQMRRMRISTLTSGVNAAIAQAQIAASDASAKATRAEVAATEAQSAANFATQKATEVEAATANLTDMITEYYTAADQGLKRRLVELAQMADSGLLEVSVESFQLFDDFRRVTGFVGSYEDFLSGLCQGGVMLHVDDSLSGESLNPVQNKVVKIAIDGKQDIITYMTNQDMRDLFSDLL